MSAGEVPPGFEYYNEDHHIIHDLEQDINRKDELIASANLLIEQLKAEVSSLKQKLKQADEDYERLAYGSGGMP